MDTKQRPDPRFRWSGRLFTVSTQCAPEGIRTPNLLIRSQMLYPLSYGCSVRHVDGRRVTLAPRSPQPRNRAIAARIAPTGGLSRTTSDIEPPRRAWNSRSTKGRRRGWRRADARSSAAYGHIEQRRKLCKKPTVRRQIPCRPRPVVSGSPHGARSTVIGPLAAGYLGCITSFVHHVDTCRPARGDEPCPPWRTTTGTTRCPGAPRERDGPKLTTTRATDAHNDPCGPAGLGRRGRRADAAARHPLDHRHSGGVDRADRRSSSRRAPWCGSTRTRSRTPSDAPPTPATSPASRTAPSSAPSRRRTPAPPTTGWRRTR